jgi:CheY-like chemotaxis protein
VRLYLPVSGAQKQAAAPEFPPREESASPFESILLVEDQESVRNLASETLSALGYRVWEAANGEEALRLSASGELAFGLLVTDVVMPGINGPQLAAELRKRNPRILVLYMTGYAGDALGAEKGHLLLKPFLPSDLAWKVREILNQRPQAAPAGLTPAPPHP